MLRTQVQWTHCPLMGTILVLISPARHPPHRPPREEIWYFAYGANMHDNAFLDWRGMCPREWRPGRAGGYRLRFNLKGPPRGRSVYANLGQAVCSSALPQQRDRDLVRLGATEGVPWWRYRPVELDTEDISGTALQAATFIAKCDEDDRKRSLQYLSAATAPSNRGREERRRTGSSSQNRLDHRSGAPRRPA